MIEKHAFTRIEKYMCGHKTHDFNHTIPAATVLIEGRKEIMGIQGIKKEESQVNEVKVTDHLIIIITTSPPPCHSLTRRLSLQCRRFGEQGGAGHDWTGEHSHPQHPQR
jgi:hypothetical protein